MKPPNDKKSDEFSRIALIQSKLAPTSPRVSIGIGDDAAALNTPAPPNRILACTDMMVEGVHFDRNYSQPSDIGHKALARALSDLAAMNGRGLAALFSIALPSQIGDDFLEGFYEGAQALARSHDVDIIGGDLSSSPSSLFIDVTGIGQATHPISRSGAKIGDWLAVSGFPGSSAAGLFALKNRSTRNIQAISDSLAKAHLRPLPRFDLLPALNSTQGLCTSLIDISDGLASETHHLAKNSDVGFEIDARSIPLHPDAVALAALMGEDPLHWALSGGEDFELLATLDSTKVATPADAPKGFTVIGRVVPQAQGVTLIRPDGSRQALPPLGHRHFTTG